MSNFNGTLEMEMRRVLKDDLGLAAYNSLGYAKVSNRLGPIPLMSIPEVTCYYQGQETDALVIQASLKILRIRKSLRGGGEAIRIPNKTKVHND